MNSLEDYRPSLITEVYSDDTQVIGSFALERRIVVTGNEIPQVVKDKVTQATADLKAGKVTTGYKP